MIKLLMGPESGAYNLSAILEHVVDGLNNKSLVEFHFAIERNELILHI